MGAGYFAVTLARAPRHAPPVPALPALGRGVTQATERAVRSEPDVTTVNSAPLVSSPGQPASESKRTKPTQQRVSGASSAGKAPTAPSTSLHVDRGDPWSN